MPKDNFSKQSHLYAQYRPTYPTELYDWLLAHVQNKQKAWDVGTGNGQVAVQLAEHFDEVEATDISQAQVDKASPRPNVHYSIQAAEQTNFADLSFNLITIGQAIHWFNFEAFYKEVRRVAQPNAVIATWCYALLNISPDIDALIEHFYRHTTANYWDFERRYIDEHYQTIPFPFQEIKVPDFSIRVQWTPAHLEGYLNSWSSIQKYIGIHQSNPIPELMEQIAAHWPAEEVREVVFPIYMRVGRVEK